MIGKVLDIPIGIGIGICIPTDFIKPAFRGLPILLSKFQFDSPKIAVLSTEFGIHLLDISWVASAAIKHILCTLYNKPTYSETHSLFPIFSDDGVGKNKTAMWQKR